MNEKATFIKKGIRVFGILCMSLTLCITGLTACNNKDSESSSNNDPDKGSGFEDVIPTPESSSSLESSVETSVDSSLVSSSDELVDESSETSSEESSESSESSSDESLDSSSDEDLSSESSSDTSSDTSEEVPEGDISAGNPDPDYGNGELPF